MWLPTYQSFPVSDNRQRLSRAIRARLNPACLGVERLELLIVSDNPHPAPSIGARYLYLKRGPLRGVQASVLLSSRTKIAEPEGMGSSLLDGSPSSPRSTPVSSKQKCTCESTKAMVLHLPNFAKSRGILSSFWRDSFNTLRKVDSHETMASLYSILSILHPSSETALYGHCAATLA